jgi:hypothetical protein
LQIREGALIALRVLETCPLVPVDAFVGLAGLSSLSSAYQQLARLRRGGLADARRVDAGYLVGERRLGCWTITDDGRRILAQASVHRPGEQKAVAQGRHGPAVSHKRARIRDSDVPLLIAAYRLLASVVLERGAGELTFEVLAWEWPWIRELRSTAELLRLKLPAGAILRAREPGGQPDLLRDHMTEVVLVPDLGTAPVVCNREMLRRLVAFREAAGLGDGPTNTEPELVIATPDPDGTGARRRAWLELLDRIERRYGGRLPRVRVLTWESVSGTVAHARSSDVCGDDMRSSAARQSGPPLAALQRVAPARSREQLLHLIGRHPCLTVDHLAGLLGTTVHRIRRLETELIEDGLLRRIEFNELPRGARAVTHEDFAALGLVEITSMGRRRLAGWLGVSQAAASRYHGVTGNGRSERGRRRRLLRALAHTVGTNAVFVAFAVAADAVRRAGGSDLLTEWRGAAVCERRYCKPDGYGCYQRGDTMHGFFLEFDRGTEGTRQYVSKLNTYYRYRDSSLAARDYNGFPTLLFVTIDPRAEHGIAEAARRAAFLRGGNPLDVLTTTTTRIRSHEAGILGPIWQSHTTDKPSPLLYWLKESHPRGSVIPRFPVTGLE